MSIKAHPPHELHIPVLLDACLAQLNPSRGETYLDLTAGYGGHASAFIDITGNVSGATLVDRDDYAISHLQKFADSGARLLQADFVSAAMQLVEEDRKYDIIMVDLGVSSPQLDQAERGFSFTNSGPLDMRMDRSQDFTAEKLVNTYSLRDIEHIIRVYGEESPAQAKRIATAIVQARPFVSTDQLASVIKQEIRGKWGKTHPATRTFQALRIAVNKELDQIEQMLPLLPKLLSKGGRVGVISFHSLEDRLVKRYFAEQTASGYEAELRVLTKKPILGSLEDANNPRSRSAKLRVAVKI